MAGHGLSTRHACTLVGDNATPLQILQTPLLHDQNNVWHQLEKSYRSCGTRLKNCQWLEDLKLILSLTNNQSNPAAACNANIILSQTMQSFQISNSSNFTISWATCLQKPRLTSDLKIVCFLFVKQRCVSTSPICRLMERTDSVGTWGRWSLPDSPSVSTLRLCLGMTGRSGVLWGDTELLHLVVWVVSLLNLLCSPSKILQIKWSCSSQQEKEEQISE